jgi:hypothetical protein
MATLKDTYGKLNTQSSISDYLTSVGQDNSLEARTALGQKYGITGIGTAEGNTNLLNALKSGTNPATIPVAGTIAGATPPVVTPANPIDTSQPYNDGTGIVNPVGGSVAGAAGTQAPATPVNDGTVNTDPNVVNARNNYEASYQQQQSAQKAVAEIDATLASIKKSKMDEIARSGGVVNQASLQSEILRENEPLLAQRKVLASEYSAANSNYQKAQKDKIDAESNFVKQSQLDLAQNKQSEVEAQNKIKNDQAQVKLEQAGYKPQKVNITDSAGNVLGQSIQTWVNPANKNLGVTSDGTNVILGTSKGGSATATPIGNNSLPTVGSKDTPPKGVTIAAGFTPTQVYQALISGPNKPVKGIVGGVDQETLYNAAIDLIMGVASTQGARIPAAAAFSVQQKKTEIMNAYGLNEADINIAKTQFKNLSSTNAALLQRTSLLNIAGNAALDNLDLAVKASANVPRGGAKIVNSWSQWLSGNYTPNGPLAALETAIYTYGREYARVTSGATGSAGLTDSAQSEVDKLINAAQSPEVFSSITDMMKSDMQNVIKRNNEAVNAFPAAVTKLYGFTGGQGGAPGGGGATTVQSNGQSYNVGQVYNDGTGNWTVDAQGNWTKQ